MSATSRKHFVTFYSPGTFVDEQTVKPIDSWDVRAAVALSRGIVERHGAKPYGFHFSTCLVAEPIPDGEGGTLNVGPKEVSRSGMYHLGGRLRTVDDVRRDADSSEKILLFNMECNGLWVIVENRNSYKHCAPFAAEDCLLDESGNILDRGDDPRWVLYFARKAEEKQQERAAIGSSHK